KPASACDQSETQPAQSETVMTHPPIFGEDESEIYNKRNCSTSHYEMVPTLWTNSLGCIGLKFHAAVCSSRLFG
ncbi:hypothetical protein, partial [uncultured Roseovarius sp.]|uniref:hypothetical protein n=1 Tax=uncultured Roseovarius sp. TaxID=293344 RepID=UPI00263806C6